jgi:ketosteroid isomerase-like protein
MSRPEYGNPGGLIRDAEVVRAIYAAFARRDAEAVIPHITPDCELHLRGTADASGRTRPYVGPDGVRSYFADVAAIWDELSLFAEDLRVMPDVVIVLGHVEARRGDTLARRAVMWTWRLRDAKVTSVRVADAGEFKPSDPS